MLQQLEHVKLRDGTLIRHKVVGYEGRIDGITGIKACFTSAGKLLESPGVGQIFQYRVMVKGESIRRIAPSKDLEVLEGVEEVVCSRCHFAFYSKPGMVDKAGGRCQCGAWICPSCLACGNMELKATKNDQSLCPGEKKRLMRKFAAKKRKKTN